jgi:amidase
MTDHHEDREHAGMNRRSFIRRAAAGGALLAAGPVRAAFAGPGAGGGSEASGGGGSRFDLEEATVAGLQEEMGTGRTTSRDLTRKYLVRIGSMDKTGPALHHVIETNPEALAIAEALDAERKRKGLRGPLHGIPVLVKDNVATADRMQTTAGSLALAGAAPPRDSFVAKKLRDAGAVILGKANLSEWANFRSTHSSSGWSARGGQGKNPYALDRNPCGSSSGSGAGVSANYCTVAVGTETDGSVVCPSATNGVVGMKPTLGLVSRAGIVPISHTQDTAGPIARTVTDAAVLLTALAGADPADPATAASAGHVEADYTRYLDPNGLRGARIGVAREKFFGYSAKADAVIETAIKDLERLGATIVDPANIPHAGDYDDAEFEVLLYEFKADLEKYFREWAPTARVKTLKDVIDFNERNHAAELRYFGQEIMVMAEAKGPLTDPDYQDALAKCKKLSRDEGLDAVMNENRLDAVIMPTGGPAWTTDLVNGDHYLGGSSTPAAVSGYPSITVPAGFVFGLPIGLSFVARAWEEPKLLRLAFAYEQGTHHRRPPRFLPAADLGIQG